MAKISASENAKIKKFSINDDGTLSLLTLKKKIRNISGLRYRDKGSGNLRALSIQAGYFHLPLGVSWNDYVFYCVYNEGNMESRNKCCTLAEYYDLNAFDMIVMAVPDTVGNDEFYRYFSSFGKLNLCELKKDRTTGRGQGYGFLKFANFDEQLKCINSELRLAGGQMYLRLPTNKLEKSVLDRRIFVSNITPSVTLVDLLEYFNVYGKICEIFMPAGLVPHAFITFEREDAAYHALRFGESHRVFGGFVMVEKIVNKKDMEYTQTKKIYNEPKYQGFSEDVPSKDNTPRDPLIQTQTNGDFNAPSDGTNVALNTNTEICSTLETDETHEKDNSQHNKIISTEYMNRTYPSTSNSSYVPTRVPQPLHLPTTQQSFIQNSWKYPQMNYSNAGSLLQSPPLNAWEFLQAPTQQRCVASNSMLLQQSSLWTDQRQASMPQFHPPNIQSCPQKPQAYNSLDCGNSMGEFSGQTMTSNNIDVSVLNNYLIVNDEKSMVEHVPDVTEFLLRTCYSQSEKKSMAKRLLDIIAEPGLNSETLAREDPPQDYSCLKNNLQPPQITSHFPSVDLDADH